MSEEFGWPPQVIAQMTPAQMLVYLGPATKNGKVRVASMKEARELLTALRGGQPYQE